MYLFFKILVPEIHVSFFKFNYVDFDPLRKKIRAVKKWESTVSSYRT